MANFYGQFIGFGAGGAVPPYVHGGLTYGFLAGGLNDPSISRFSFTSDGDGEDWGDLSGTSTQMINQSGHSDKANGYGYACGGSAGGAGGNEINRFLMASSGTSADVGDCTQNTMNASSSDNATHGWNLGHEWNAGGGGDGTVVEYFAFAASSNSSDWHDLTQNKHGAMGSATNPGATHGYCGGSYDDSGISTEIQKISLSSQEIATVIGDNSAGGHTNATFASAIHMYRAAGWNVMNVIDRMSFASEGTADDFGDLAGGGRQQCTGVSSTTNGYCCGGVGNSNVIDKIDFSSGGGSSDIGNLSHGAVTPAGAQV